MKQVGAVCCAIFMQYSAPPLRFKAKFFLDALSNAAYAFPLVFVPLAFGEPPIWGAAIGLMAWSVAKHTFDAVQDIDEDRAAGIGRVTAAALLDGNCWVGGKSRRIEVGHKRVDTGPSLVTFPAEWDELLRRYDALGAGDTTGDSSINRVEPPVKLVLLTVLQRSGSPARQIP